ncbi:hypothetical protein DJ568_07625 [Mucilaginibacter hurinus]|uniref:IPT/TIG domain-containing protein n=1 Tax=Mucilaginibacter hurinus TaxID=2201324 RepID=A0A367GSR8_9SPHI|nr:IPT/TIG domain-containing protein [Mucilaginibacter hurinus]RCH55743.1 hypothetical protein DJ568_07625 [Mucilaginibacter hurinus]
MNILIRTIGIYIILTILVGCKKDTGISKVAEAGMTYNNALPKPVITAISPSKGTIYGAVKITGSGFSTVVNGNIVRFNGIPATVNSFTSTEIVATVPANASTGNITVLSNDFTATSPAPFKILKYVPNGKLAINLDGLTEVAISKTGVIYGVIKRADKFAQIIKYTNGASTVIFNNAPEFKDQLNYFEHEYKGLLVSQAGEVYFASNYINNRSVNGTITRTVLQSHIVKINTAGQASLVAGADAGAVDGNGANARFRNIEAMAMDAAGNIYVSDFGNSRLRKVTPSADVTTLPAAVKIKRLAISAGGDLYFHDNNKVYSVNAATRRVSVIAGPYANGLGNMLFDAEGNLLVNQRTSILVINKANFGSEVKLPAITFAIAVDADRKLLTFTSKGVTRYALTE